MPASPRDVLTPSAFETLQLIADTGSFAAAARALNMVPSALTYRVKQIEQALGVRVFQRGAQRAVLSDAGAELLREGAALLADVDAIAQRVRQLAAGWEPQLTIAVDALIDRATVMQLCETFYAQSPPTRLRLRSDTLAGTLEAVTHDGADLALGVLADVITEDNPAGVAWKPLGATRFVFAVAPGHPLATADEPLSDASIVAHRAVVLADSARQVPRLDRNLIPGQDAITVTDLSKKIDAQVEGLGVGFLPRCRAWRFVEAGRLVVKRVTREPGDVHVGYAWHAHGRRQPGRALRWWLDQLESAATRAALLGDSGRVP